MQKNNPQPDGDCGQFARMDSVLEALSNDLAAVGDDHESGRLHRFDEFSQLYCLGTVHNCDDDLLGPVRECASGLIDRCAVVKLLHNIIADWFRIIADDVEGLAQVDAFDDVIHHKGFHQQTQYGVKSCLDAEGKESGEDDQTVCHQQGIADVDAGVFFQDHGDDIGAAGGSADIEQDGGCKAGDCDTVAKFQNRLIGQGLCHGTDHLHCGKDDGIKNADIRCFRTEAFAQNEKANDKQGVADHKVDGGGGEGEVILQNQRQTGDAAEGEIIGEAEKMAAERIDQGAERHDDQFSEPAAAQFDVHYVLPNLS